MNDPPSGKMVGPTIPFRMPIILEHMQTARLEVTSIAKGAHDVVQGPHAKRRSAPSSHRFGTRNIHGGSTLIFLVAALLTRLSFQAKPLAAGIESSSPASLRSVPCA